MNKKEIFALVLGMVSKETEINTSEILSTCKLREVVDARHLLVALLYDTGLYPKQIATMLGMSDRSVSYAITNFQNRALNEKILRNSYERLRKQLGNK